MILHDCKCTTEISGGYCLQIEKILIKIINKMGQLGELISFAFQ